MRIATGEHYQVDLLPASNSAGRKVAVTFMSWNHPGTVDLEGNGYAADPLLNDGFDVVAVKTARNYWYQDLDCLTLSAVRNICGRYAWRVGYGSSMGGYAAIQFAKALSLNRILALSPQFEIDQSWDTRWAKEAEQIIFQHRISADCISHECEYFLAYDPMDRLDKGHIELFRSVIPKSNLRLRPICFAGHPVGPLLAQTRCLKPFALNILNDDDDADIHSNIRLLKKTAPVYLYQLALHLFWRGRWRPALAIVDRAIALNRADAEYHFLRAALLARLDDRDQAIAAARLAANLIPHAAHFKHYLSILLMESGQPRAALEAINEALAISSASEYLDHRGRLGAILYPPNLPGLARSDRVFWENYRAKRVET